MEQARWRLDLGARPIDDGRVRFRVWAPRAESVLLRIEGLPEPVPMIPQQSGYYETDVSGIGAGTRYRYILNRQKDYPDPASRYQPEGVHGPSCVVDPDGFPWTDRQWAGLPLSRLIIYELHVGTFTAEGTFAAVIPHLEYLCDIGVTAVELMPVAQFPGRRNWGYDGVCPFAPQSSYGGPDGLKRLVDACHARSLAVILDVVYNHLGPEGNYLHEYGPYFTDRYRTPWGSAINYDGPDSDEVRHYIMSNALYWASEYHVDGLRLDAIHGIFDFGAYHILQEIAEGVHEFGRRQGRTILVIAESDLNDVRVITPPAEGGYGLDAQWSDDCHHALHTLLTGERAGYYEDFGRLDQLATALQKGFVYSGQHSTHRRRRHGSSSRSRPPAQLVVFSQNHDQVGNRASGERLSALVPYDGLKVAAATILLAPNIPLLFMGEEYGETAPFQYFIDHGDPALIEAVRQGRRKEFAAFGWQEVPDPYDASTYERSHLRLEGSRDDRQSALLRWYKSLIALRKSVPALGAAEPETHRHQVTAFPDAQIMVIHRRATRGQEALLILSFNKGPATIALCEPCGTWERRLDSASAEFTGKGSSLPARLMIATQEVPVHVPALAAGLFLGGMP